MQAEERFTNFISVILLSILIVLVSYESFKVGIEHTKSNVIYKNIYTYVMPNITIKPTDSFMAECTAYTNGYESTGKHPGDKGYGMTSSGKHTKQGYIAADTDILPYGSLVYIDGMGIYQVEDTGGDIKGNRIDIYFESRSAAYKFGRQDKKIIVLKRGY